MAFFEYRQYWCWPGKRAEWVKYMEEVIIPFQVSKGMVVVGSFVQQDDEDAYIWVRRFDSEEQRVALYAAVYESDEWVSDMGPKVPEMMDRSRIVVTRIEPTPKSVLR